MKIRHIEVLTLLTASLLMTVTVANAGPTIVGTVTLDALPGVYPGLGGGEFTAYTSQNYLNNYAADATYTYNGQTGFETFCIETGVDFTPGNWGGPTYYYSLGNVSQPVPANGVGSGLNLSAGTAWLYSQFATGHLSGFDYGAGRGSDDNLLQAAIWAFQGPPPQTYPGYTVPSADPASPDYNQFYAEAITALGGLTSADGAYTGTSVQILQMWSNSDGTGAAQNQLVLVPDGGMTVALLGGSLVGLQSLRRKRVC